MLCPYLTCGRGALQGLLLGELTSERAYMARQERLHLSPHLHLTKYCSKIVLSSVADLGCLSQILIYIHLGSQIPDLGSKNTNKREGRKKFVVLPLFVATNIKKFKLNLF